MREIELNILNKGFLAIAGIDEVGRGPLAGPVVAASVILPEGFSLMGLDDSKKLTEKKREELYEKLLASNCCYGIKFVPREIIDEIGIKQATHLAMKSAVQDLKIMPEYLLIDGNDNIPYSISYEYVVKGDAKCDCIAAASIIAKVERDRYMVKMAEIYPQYGFEQHKGYGTAAHIAAIQKYGICELHRRSFMTKKVLGTAV